MTAAVWGVGFRSVSARTPPEQRQKHRFLQRPRAIWRAPVRKVEQLLFWMRIEAEQQRERDLTRRSAARRTFRALSDAPISVANGRDLDPLRGMIGDI